MGVGQAMGWGLGWEQRNTFLGDALRYVPSATDREFTSALCAIDFNAAARSQAIGGKPPCVIAKQLLRVAGFNSVQRNRLAIFCDNDQIPELRQAVHSQRAKRISKRPIVLIRELKAETSTRSLGKYEWSDFWATVSGKRYGIELLADAMRHEIKAASWDGCEATMTLPYNSTTTWTIPFDGSGTLPVPSPAYGEAEAQLVLYAERYVAQGLAVPVVILTIDTDILLQTMCLHLPRTYILIATVWALEPKRGTKRKRETDAGTFFRTKKAATKKSDKDTKIVKYNEYISCGAVRRSLGPGVVDMANAMLWMLLAARVDYNGSIGSFGWNSQTCLAQVRVMVLTDMTRARTRLDTNKLFNALRISRDRRRRDTDVDAFVNELNLVLYCLSYYLWYDDDRALPGPVLTPYLATDSCETVYAYLLRKRPEIVIANLFPSTEMVHSNRFGRSRAEFIATGRNR